MENRFINKVRNKSNAELERIIANNSDFQKEMIIAAIAELEGRGEFVEKREEIIDTFEKKEAEMTFRKKEKTKFIPEDLPRTIKFSAYLLYTSILISIVLASLNGFGTNDGIISFNIGLILMTVLAVYVHRGSNSARWALTLLMGLGVLLKVALMIPAFGVRITVSIQSLIQLAAVILLYVDDSRAWYRSQCVEDNDEEEITIYVD